MTQTISGRESNGNTRLLEVTNLCVAIRGEPVLQDVSLGLRRGQIKGILGPNGGGKTTLLRTIAGLQGYSSGRILFPCRETGQRRPPIGYLPQKETWGMCSFPVRTYDLVRIGRGGGVWGREPARCQVDRVLTDMGIDRHLWGRPIGELSGGQRRLVLLAMMLSTGSRLLLLDEPTEALDNDAKRRFRRALRRIRADDDRGRGVLVVTHDPDLYTEFDEVIGIAGGVFARQAPAQIPHGGHNEVSYCNPREETVRAKARP